MRMSDWSSDVCSSDLPAADCPTGFTNAGVIANLRNCSITGRINNDLNIPKRAGTIYSLVGRVDVGTAVGGDGAAVGGQGVTLSVDPGVELGRATCRERVCQDVSISVVAVSFKNKKTTK